MINPFDMEKHREILFAAEPDDQVNRALAILNDLPHLKVLLTGKSRALDVYYNLRDYTLSGLENALEQEGFVLDHSFMHHVGRNIIHYCEDTCRHNMEIRGHVTKKNEKDVFVEVGSHETHHEYAARPPQQREYE